MPEGTVKIKENTEEELINLSYRSVQAVFSCSTGVRAIEMRSTDGGKECYLEKRGCWKSVLMCLEDSILGDFCVLQSPTCFCRRVQPRSLRFVVFFFWVEFFMVHAVQLIELRQKRQSSILVGFRFILFYSVSVSNFETRVFAVQQSLEFTILYPYRCTRML